MEHDFVGDLLQQARSTLMFRIDQDDGCVVHFVHDDSAVYLLTQRLIQRRIDGEEGSRLAFNTRSVPAPSGMFCGSKANTRSLKKVPAILRGIISARGSCDIV